MMAASAAMHHYQSAANEGSGRVISGATSEQSGQPHAFQVAASGNQYNSVYQHNHQNHHRTSVYDHTMEQEQQQQQHQMQQQPHQHQQQHDHYHYQQQQQQQQHHQHQSIVLGQQSFQNHPSYQYHGSHLEPYAVYAAAANHYGELNDQYHNHLPSSSASSSSAAASHHHQHHHHPIMQSFYQTASEQATAAAAAAAAYQLQQSRIGMSKIGDDNNLANQGSQVNHFDTNRSSSTSSAISESSPKEPPKCKWRKSFAPSNTDKVPLPAPAPAHNLIELENKQTIPIDKVSAISEQVPKKRPNERPKSPSRKLQACDFGAKTLETSQQLHHRYQHQHEYPVNKTRAKLDTNTLDYPGWSSSVARHGVIDGSSLQVNVAVSGNGNTSDNNSSNITPTSSYTSGEQYCAVVSNQNEQPQGYSSAAQSSNSEQQQATYANSSSFDDKEDYLELNCNNQTSDYNQLRTLEMRKEKSRDAARSRRSKENHEFYELAKLLPLPAAITSQLDFLDKASIIRLTISFLKLRQFSVNGHPPWAPDFTTLGSINPYSSQQQQQTRPESSLSSHVYQSSSNIQEQELKPAIASQSASRPASTSTSGYRADVNHATDNLANMPPASVAFPPVTTTPILESQHYNQSHLPAHEKPLLSKTSNLFDIHQGTHILQSLDGFAFAIGRDGRFLYISETVSMYLGLSQVEMTGSSVFDYTHQQDHEELARQLGIPYNEPMQDFGPSSSANCNSPAPASVKSQYSAASTETLIDDYVNSKAKKFKAATSSGAGRGSYNNRQRNYATKRPVGKHAMDKLENNNNDEALSLGNRLEETRADNKAHSMIDMDNEDNKSANSNNARLQGTNEDPLVRQFCVRMKSTLTKRGCQHFRSSGYRVVHVVAHLRSYQSNDHGHLMDPLDNVPGHSGQQLQPSQQSKQQTSKRRGPKASGIKLETKRAATGPKMLTGETLDTVDSSERVALNGLPPGARASGQQNKIIGMVAVAIALPPPSINELRLESDTFVLRLGLDLRVTHIEPKISELLHYPVELIAGKSYYSLIHPADAHQVQRCHRDLLCKGQMMSGYYRLLSRTGGYIWVQTCATLICNNTISSAAAGPSGAISVAATPMGPGGASSPMLTPLAHQFGNYAASSLEVSSPQFHQQHPIKKCISPIVQPVSTAASSEGQLEQDQCIIFVNSMITNVIERDQILDVCQRLNYLASPTNNSSSSNSSIFEQKSVISSNQTSMVVASLASSKSAALQSPLSSARPSPCLSMKPPTPNNNNNNNYPSAPATPITCKSTPATHRRATTSDTAQKSSREHHKTANSKTMARSQRVNNIATPLQTSNQHAPDENGHGHLLALKQINHSSILQAETATNYASDSTSAMAAAAAAAAAYNYCQVPGSVNLAADYSGNNAVAASVQHQQQQVQAQPTMANHWPASGDSAYSSIVEAAGASQPAAVVAAYNNPMNRSFYSAAFGTGYQQPVYPANTSHYYQPHVAPHYHNQQPHNQHHHHQQTTAQNNQSTLDQTGYYNYLGNKFI